MPVFHDYSENGKLLSTREELLNSDNFSRYVSEQGNERAQGYLDAVNDMMNYIDNRILHHPWNEEMSPNTPAVIRRELKEFFHERELFLDFINRNQPEMDKPVSPKP